MSRPTPPLRNNVVLASAGSGKTFRLSDRIVKLLALGVKPEEIVALTFTRAAAAEFVAKTLDKLAEAAGDPAKAAELRARLGLDATCDQAFFRALLRRTLLSMQRLTLGTLDSFFARLVVNNPAEVGLDGPEVRTMDDLEGAQARRGVLREVLASTDPAELREVARELRDLNQGKDVAMPIATFESRVAELHDLLTLAPEPSLWGRAERVWGETPRLLTAPTAEAVAAAARDLVAWVEGSSFHATLRKSLAEHIPALAGARSAGEIDDKHWKLVARTLRAVTDGADGREATIHYSRKDITFPAAICGAYRTLAAHAMAMGVRAKLGQTQAIRRLLGRYEAVYARQVRRRGRLTFSDYVTLLLNADESVKLGMDYRLDCRVRHWLFDEFQDTSTRQWKVLANNLAEVLDADGDEWRTAFFVGDLKQSLYGWRAGNPRLLADIRDRMVRQEGAAAEDRLTETRRCSQPVVDMVNALLGDLLPHGPFLSPAAAEKWAATFETHRTAAKRPEDGEALWVRLPEAEEGDEEEAEESSVARQARWIGEHLKSGGLLEGRRLRAGTTCAVLVSKNDQAAEITETLRRMGIEAADEGETSVTQDNPLTAGLVALVRAAAHPGDRRAQGLAEMSSAGRAALARLGGWEQARERLADLLQARGAEGLVQELLREVDLAGADNAHAFLRKRARQLVALAVAYDQTGERSLEGLCGHLEGSSLRDTADPRSVQVLTIHRSKGLQYTCVYLPCLNNARQPLASVRADMPMVKEAADFSPEWILSRPKSAICDLDATLGAQVEREAADVAYENLCRIYVGMTRAVRRLVLITDALKPDKLAALRDEKMHGKYDVAMLLEAALSRGEAGGAGIGEAAVAWSTGSDAWIAREVSAETPVTAPAPVAAAWTPVARPERLKPSSAGKHAIARTWAPSQQVAAGKAFGSLVHDLMESLGWDIAAFETELKSKTAGTTDPILVAAREQILACLASPAVRGALGTRPEGALLWTERQASLMHDGKLMHAVFDRVHVVPGKEAMILDYKTNDGLTDAELAETYRGQMGLYREAVSKLANVPQDKVRCVLIHVRRGTVVDV